MQKLQLSRAAQAAAVQALASMRPSSSPWISGMTSGLARQAPPLDLGGGAAAALPSPPLPSQPPPPSAGGSGAPEKGTGFNSFMAEGLMGWRTELLSLRLRQAVMAEFLATALFVGGGLFTIMTTAPSMGGEGFSVAPMNATGRFPEQAPFVGLADVVLSGPALNGDVTAVGLSYINKVPRFMGISFAFGLLVCCMVFSTGAISGGNLNPSVTLALYMQGKMSGLRMLLYIVAQCAGAIAGAYYAFSLSPDLFRSVNGGVNDLDPTVLSSAWGGSWWTALGAEICGTALLVFTVSAAADVGRERANKYVGALTPLMIGLCILVCHVALIPIDGCSLNPARSLASAVVMNKWDSHYIFWLGPLLGGPMAAILYDRVFYTGVSDTSVQVRPLDNLAVVLARLQSSAAERWDASGSGSPRGAAKAAATAATAATAAAAAAVAAENSQDNAQNRAQEWDQRTVKDRARQWDQQTDSRRQPEPQVQGRRSSRAGSASSLQVSSSSHTLAGFGLPIIAPVEEAPGAAGSSSPTAATAGGSLRAVSPVDGGSFLPSPGVLSQRQLQRRMKCVVCACWAFYFNPPSLASHAKLRHHTRIFFFLPPCIPCAAPLLAQLARNKRNIHTTFVTRHASNTHTHRTSMRRLNPSKKDIKSATPIHQRCAGASPPPGSSAAHAGAAALPNADAAPWLAARHVYKKLTHA